MIAEVGALVAGLLGGPHCIGMCGGFAGAAGARGNAGAAAWHLGRGSVYVALGAAAGGAGGFAQDLGPFGIGAVVLALGWFALRLAGVLPEAHGGGQGPLGRRVTALAAWFARRSSVPARAGFGAATALLPCGLLWSALAMAGASGGTLRGAGVMGAFWLGTVPALAVASIALRRLAAAHPFARRAVAVTVFAAGLAALTLRAQPTPDAAPPCHAASGARAGH